MPVIPWRAGSANRAVPALLRLGSLSPLNLTKRIEDDTMSKVKTKYRLGKAQWFLSMLLKEGNVFSDAMVREASLKGFPVVPEDVKDERVRKIVAVHYSGAKFMLVIRPFNIERDDDEMVLDGRGMIHPSEIVSPKRPEPEQASV